MSIDAITVAPTVRLVVVGRNCRLRGRRLASSELGLPVTATLT
jgi:hypothetical protein